jgi:hypothetical protein
VEAPHATIAALGQFAALAERRRISRKFGDVAGYVAVSGFKVSGK